MPLIFPNNPTIGDQTTGVNNVVYEWDGEKWKSISTADTPTLIASGDTKAEVTDTGSDGQFKVYTENTEQFTISPSGDATLLSQNELRFSDADNSNYVGLKAPTAASGNIVWTLPPADGIAEQVLGTNGSGELYWTAGGGASVVVSSGAPASPDVGDVWFDTDEMRSYVYYDDGTSSQWVEMNPSWNGTVDDGSITPAKLSTGGPSWTASGDFSVDTNTLYVDATNNRVGINTTSPAEAFTLGSGNAQITGGQLTVGVTGTSGLQFINNGTFGTLNSIPLIFRTASDEKARIDTSGRLLVGTSSPRSNLYNASYTPTFQFETNQSAGLAARSLSVSYNNNGDTGGAIINLITSRGNTSGANNLVANNDELGSISFLGTDGTRPITGAAIAAYVDGAPGNLDMPGRLAFFTTADGASSPTERMRIDSSGRVTMPSQPIASLSDSRNIDLSNTILNSSNFYNTVYLNQGNYFDSGTGRFNCPVAGIYRIYFRCSQNGNANKTNVRLRKNGATINEAYSNITNDSVSSEAIVSCSNTDYLEIQVAELHAIGGSQHKQVTFQLLH